jgi:hypothetical protein
MVLTAGIVEICIQFEANKKTMAAALFIGLLEQIKTCIVDFLTDCHTQEVASWILCLNGFLIFLSFTEDKYTAVFHENSHIVRILQSVALPLIGNVCHAFMHSFNTTEVFAKPHILALLIYIAWVPCFFK